MNIREIDGVFVNLDLVKQIDIMEFQVNEEIQHYKICFSFEYSFKDRKDVDDEWRKRERIFGVKKYKTKEEAENRIREIINQNPK